MLRAILIAIASFGVVATAMTIGSDTSDARSRCKLYTTADGDEVMRCRAVQPLPQS